MMSPSSRRPRWRTGALATLVAAAAMTPARRASAQPADPYGPEPAAPPAAPAPKAPKAPKPPKAPKAPKAKPPKGAPAGTAGEGPQDPYGEATPPTPPPTAPTPPPAAPTPPTPPPAAPTTPPPAGAAGEGPQDPYGAVTPPPAPTPPAPPAPQDTQGAEIDDVVAASLVSRARQLLDIRAWADAKQLAVEALVRSPTGASAADAREIIRLANEKLGITDDAPAPLPPPGDTIPQDHDKDAHAGATPGLTAHAEAPMRGPTALASYGILGGALIGLGVVGAGDGESGGGGITGGLIVGGLAGGALGWWLGDRYDVTYAQARTIGAGATWGAVTFGLLTDVVGGANQKTTHDEVFVGSSLGVALGALGGALYARDGSLTAGDVTLVDSLGAMGVVGGLAVGEVMQPYASEAYSMNAAIGAAGGVVLGLYLAPDVEVSSGRMLRVDAYAGAGAAAPWLLYGLVHSSSTHADERVFGLLSAAGLVTGLYLGFRWTRDYDDKHLAARAHAPGKPAVEVGALGFRPAATSLAPEQGGMVLDVLRGAW